MAEISQIKLPNNATYNLRDDVHTWGGRNLLLGSMEISSAAGIPGWYNNGTSGLTLEKITMDGVPVIHFKGTPTGKYVPSIRTRNCVVLEWGQTYIMSCDIKFDKAITTAASTPQHYHIGSVENNDIYNLSILSKGGGVNMVSYTPTTGVIIPANTWQHYERIITTNANAPDASYPYPKIAPFIYGSIRNISESVECNGWVKNWKIEKGNKATDWSPAPEDIAYVNGTQLVLLS